MTRQEKKQQRLLKEELTRTQVLNLKDVESVAVYEKKTSKKPAIILAIFGALFITAGSAYLPIMDAINREPVSSKASVTRKEIPEPVVTDAEINAGIICSYDALNNSDNTDIKMVINLHLSDDKLISYDKIADVLPSVGKEAEGLASINKILPAYQALEQNNIAGYTIKTMSMVSGFEIKIAVDLTKLDIAKLPDTYSSNVITRNDFTLNDTKEIILNKAKILKYSCKISQDK